MTKSYASLTRFVCMIERKDLSEDQEKAFQHMVSFVASNNRQMLLSGYSGTGKCLDENSIIWADNKLVRLKSLSTNMHELDSAIPIDLNVLSFDNTTKRIQ